MSEYFYPPPIPILSLSIFLGCKVGRVIISAFFSKVSFNFSCLEWSVILHFLISPLFSPSQLSLHKSTIYLAFLCLLFPWSCFLCFPCQYFFIYSASCLNHLICSSSIIVISFIVIFPYRLCFLFSPLQFFLLFFSSI